MAAAPRFQVYGLDETYPYLGDYSFKVVLNPRFFKTGQELEVRVVDSDRKPMLFETKRWGRKLNITFTINKETADGVSIATVLRDGTEIGRLTWWVIKP
jgi:hypothetical protein